MTVGSYYSTLQQITNTNINDFRDFPGGPAVKTSPFKAGSVGSTLGWGTKVLHVSWSKKKKMKHKTEAIL